MSHKRSITTLDRTLQDIRGNKMLMGGVVFFLAGDFWQILPVIERGIAVDEINACHEIIAYVGKSRMITTQN